MIDTHILVVDDDAKIRQLLRRCLESEDFSVHEADGEKAALAVLAENDFDLITLDINLGDGNGLEVARDIRRGSNVPIIMVTGKDDVIDRVVGLEIGADDYITKPFHVREIIARVRTVLRRSQVANSTDEAHANNDTTSPASGDERSLKFDGWIAHLDRYELVDRDGNPSEMTSGDFKLLEVFLSNPKRPLSRERMMDLIGGQDWVPLDRTIDNQVARLRKKIEVDPSNPVLIKTVRGIGYMLATDVQKLKT